MKILGIDYGDKRIGLALADSQSIAVPYKVISYSKLADFLTELKSLIETENIATIVIGLPHSLSGQANDRLQITQSFVDYLKKNISLPIITVDEQYTSKMYTKMGITKYLDKHAATAILETWLQQQKHD